MGASLALVLCLCCFFVDISTEEVVLITDDDTLKQHLCPSSGTLPPNTSLVLSKPLLNMSHPHDVFCLIENTTDISIAPSHEVLQGGHDYVTVNCIDFIGLGFFNVTNLTIRSIVFSGCYSAISSDAVKYVNETSQFLYYCDPLHVSLFFSHCNNLRFGNVFVSWGALILGVNLCGTSVMTALLPNNKDILLSQMFIYFTDTDITPPDCNLSVTSDSFTSLGIGNIVTNFQSHPENMSLPYCGDFSLFMTQSFEVNVTLNIAPPFNNIIVAYVSIVFVNSNTTSHVEFQRLNSPYKYCMKENESDTQAHEDRTLKLDVIFYEKPSFTSKISGTLSPLLIKDTSFSNYHTDCDLNVAMVQIIKLTGKLSHEVTFHDVAWCDNDLTITYQSTKDFLSPLFIQNVASSQNMASSQVGRLHVKLHHVLMQHNNIADEPQRKRFDCLVCFVNIEATMTGINYFANNSGGTVMSLKSSNLTVSGNLTIKDGDAYQGGAISLDSMSTLFLKEPLTAKFINNTADQGNAIYAPVRSFYYGQKPDSIIQILPRTKYSLENVTNIDIHLYFRNNSNKDIARSLYAPHFSFFGKQTSSNFSFKCDKWVGNYSQHQYACTILLDSILHMSKEDKCRSLSNGLYIQPHLKDWECVYIDKLVKNANFLNNLECDNHHVTLIDIYPGQQVFSIYYTTLQLYDIAFYRNSDQNVGLPGYKSYEYWKSSIQSQNSTLSITVEQDSHDRKWCYVALLTDIEVNLFSLPILQLKMLHCPLGFELSNRTGSCKCDSRLKNHNYNCVIENETFTAPSGYWTEYDRDNDTILLDKNCPPNYCNNKSQDSLFIFSRSSTSDESCDGNRTGVLCGKCKKNHSVIFGSDTCQDNCYCSDVYLLTLLIYVMAGLLIVLLLFVFRITVATGTINGVIFYANVLGLVMEKLTENGTKSKGYVSFVRILISLLNLNLGFPLCFYKGMTTVGKVGFQFLFPVYIWSIVIILVLLSKYSARISKLISKSSVQVLATLFYLSFSKLLRTVIIILSPSSIETIETSGNFSARTVWYFDGGFDYATGTHAVLLALAVMFTALFLLPYALLVTFSSHLVRFRLVNKFKPFVDAYGGPFKDRWRIWFGLRLWITILLYGLDGVLEGTNSDAMFIVHIIVLMVFIYFQSFVRPFKNYLIGILDLFFMANYWLLVSSYFWRETFWYVYIITTASAAFVMGLVIFFHVITVNNNCRANCMEMLQQLNYERKDGYEAIGNVQEESEDADLFQAAENRVPDTY